MTKHEAVAELVVQACKRALAPVLASLMAYGERLTAVEARPLPLDGKDGEPGQKGLDGLQGPSGEQGPEGPPGPSRDGKDGARGEKGADGLQGPVGDRGPEGLAGPARDGRDGLPGVPGLQGENGKDGTHGLNGKDGADGLGFEDIEAVYDDHGRLSLRAVRGELVKTWRVPGIVDRGVYRDGESYQKGDGVTYGGGFFIAQQDIQSKPEDSSGGWRLAVKRGRDGRDGKDGGPGPEGKRGKNWEEVLDEKRKG